MRRRGPNGRGDIILGNLAADDNSSAASYPFDCGVGQFPTDIVPIDIDIIGTQCPQSGGDVFGFVVEASIKTELIGHIIDLFVCAGDAGHSANPEFGQLVDHRFHGAGSGRDHYRVAHYWPANLKETEISGQPWHTEGGGDRSYARVDFAELASIEDLLFLPTDLTHSDISLHKTCGSIFDYLA